MPRVRGMRPGRGASKSSMNAWIAGICVALVAGAVRAGEPAPVGAPNPKSATADDPKDASEITLTLDAVDRVRAPSSGPGLGYLAGRALAHQGDLELFDVVFVIDTSGSTAEASGIGEGSGWLKQLGVSVSRAESILGAEVAAIESLLDGFDPRTTRVGLVSFAGELDPRVDSAWVEAPLTSDYRELRRALEDRMLVDPEGGTNLRAGLLRGGVEVLGTRSAESRPRRNAGRHLVVLTDGLPTLPQGDPEGGAIRAARSLAKRGVRVHVFEIGAASRARSRSGEKVADLTHGEHHTVTDISKLAPLLGEIEFRALRELRVTNLSTGATALELLKDPDGGYAALLPVIAGKNRVEILAIASDGRQRRIEREMVFGDVDLDVLQRERLERLLALQAGEDARKNAAKQKTLTVQPEPEKP